MSRKADLSQTYSPGPWLRRLARFSAWALLVGVVVLVVSGWGITQTGIIYNLTFGLIDRRLANAIHRLTNLPLTFFFLVHVLINVKISLTRRFPARAWLINGSLIVLGLAVLAAAVYLDHFRKGG
jgi:cytochrome b subunit of formate dehydrogenase